MAPGWKVRFEQEKRKLLFSFVTNTVKMFGFVEPAQRIVFVRPETPRVRSGLTWGQQGKPANKWVLAKGFKEW